jgi:predicted PurR-regulated permease PerM
VSGDRRVTGLVNLAAAILVVAALYWAREVLVPFALAVVLSFLLGPVVGWLQRYRVHRAAAVMLTVLMVFGATGLLGWVVYGQFRELAAVLPQYRETIREKVETARRALEPSMKASKTVADIGAQLAPPDQKAAPQDVTDVRVVEPPRDAGDVIHDVVTPTLSVLVTAAMVIVFTFVMLLRRGDLRDRFIRLAGDGRILVTTQALDETAQRVSSYLGRLLLVNGIYGTAMALGLWALDVPKRAALGRALGRAALHPLRRARGFAAAFPVLTSLATSRAGRSRCSCSG